MRVRRWFGFAVAAAYVGVLAYVTEGAQCPVDPESGCAKVHALMLAARPPVAPPPMLAAPMRADPVSEVLRLVRVATRGEAETHFPLRGPSEHGAFAARVPGHSST